MSATVRLTDAPALLPCSACGEPTRHELEGRHATRSRFDDATEIPTVEVIYECTACGRRRRWGLEASHARP